MDKIVFIQLCPDGASIKKKMVYASSASAIKASLGTERILQFQVCSTLKTESNYVETCMMRILPRFPGVHKIVWAPDKDATFSSILCHAGNPFPCTHGLDSHPARRNFSSFRF